MYIYILYIYIYIYTIYIYILYTIYIYIYYIYSETCLKRPAWDRNIWPLYRGGCPTQYPA